MAGQWAIRTVVHSSVASNSNPNYLEPHDSFLYIFSLFANDQYSSNPCQLLNKLARCRLHCNCETFERGCIHFKHWLLHIYFPQKSFLAVNIGLKINKPTSNAFIAGNQNECPEARETPVCLTHCTIKVSVE